MEHLVALRLKLVGLLSQLHHSDEACSALVGQLRNGSSDLLGPESPEDLLSVHILDLSRHPSYENIILGLNVN